MQIKSKRTFFTSVAALAIIALMLLPTFVSNAAGTAFEMTSDSSVRLGEEFTVELKVSSNSGFKGFEFELHYSNTALKLVKVEFSEALKKLDDEGKASLSTSSVDAIPFKLTFASGSNFTSDTTLVKFTFKLSNKAKLEKHEVYVSGTVLDVNNKETDVSSTKGGAVAVCSHDTNPALWVQFNHTEATCTTPSRTYYRCSECQQQKTEIGTELKPHRFTDHEHKNATCTENGYDKQICRDCNTVVTTKTYPATGHKFSDTVDVVLPTCIAEGYSVSKCTVCSEEVKTDFTSKIPHDMKESSRLAPTCHTVGYIRYTCSVCPHQSETIIDTVEHNYFPDTVVEPTHINKGYTVYKCKYEGCTQTYNSDYTDVLPHTFEYTVVKEPTCTETGFKTGICTAGCNVTEDVEIPATGHSFGDWYVAVEATQFYDGYEERSCSHCDIKETKIIAKLTDDPNADDQKPKGKIQAAIAYITDANHPAVIAISLFAVIIAMVCFAYIIVKIRIIR